MRSGRDPFGSLTACTLALALAVVSGAACGPAPPRNVVVILVDALRSDRMGVYGHAGGNTPNIDRLARRGVVYENAYSTSTWTVPAVASLFTSTLPVVHRINRSPTRQFAFSVLDDEYVLANEIFEQAGFATGMVTTIGWVSERAGYDQGVDEFIKTSRQDAVMVAEARDFIQRHKEDRFHLYLHFIDLHDYYAPERIFTEGHREGLDEDSALYELKEMTPDESYKHLDNVLAVDGRISRRDIDWLLEVYDRELRLTDGFIGLLADDLKQAGLLDETLIVVTADHGEEFLEHRRMTHGGQGFYSEVLRVPLVLSGPGLFTEARRIATPVSLIDVYPTILEVMGLQPSDLAQGRSMLRGEEADRAVFATDGKRWKVITRHWSYFVDKEEERLFDLSIDPGEQVNLIGDAGSRGILSDLRARLQAMQSDSRDHAYLEIVPNPAAATMSEEEREALRSLGYLE